MNDFSQLFLSVHVQLQQSHKVQHFNMRMEQKDLKCCQLTLCPTCHPKIAKVTQNSPTAAAAFSKLTAAFHCQEGNVNVKKSFKEEYHGTLVFTKLIGIHGIPLVFGGFRAEMLFPVFMTIDMASLYRVSQQVTETKS